MYPFVTEAYAQAAGGAAASPLASILPFVLIFIIFYFLLIRPQQKKQKEHQKMLSELKKGDRVVTTGGLYGTITRISETIATLEIAHNTRVEVDRNHIQLLVKEGKESKASKAEKDKKADKDGDTDDKESAEGKA